MNRPKIREKKLTKAKIKLEVYYDEIEYPKGSYTNKFKILSITIDKGYCTTSTAFKCNKTGYNKLIKFIKEECRV